MAEIKTMQFGPPQPFGVCELCGKPTTKDDYWTWIDFVDQPEGIRRWQHESCRNKDLQEVK